MEESKLGGILFSFHLDGLCMCGAFDLYGPGHVDKMGHFANSKRLDGNIRGLQTTDSVR